MSKNALKRAMIPLLALGLMGTTMPYGTMEEQAGLRHRGPTATPSTERGYDHKKKTQHQLEEKRKLKNRRKLRKQKGHKHGGARK